MSIIKLWVSVLFILALTSCGNTVGQGNVSSISPAGDKTTTQISPNEQESAQENNDDLSDEEFYQSKIDLPAPFTGAELLAKLKTSELVQKKFATRPDPHPTLAFDLVNLEKNRIWFYGNWIDRAENLPYHQF